jgi:hypothetical protein
MRTVELLEQAIEVAGRLGYRVRHEWLGGTGGGSCEFGGKRWIFVDLSLSIDEQLDQVVESLKADPSVYLHPVGRHLSVLLDIPRAA